MYLLYLDCPNPIRRYIHEPQNTMEKLDRQSLARAAATRLQTRRLQTRRRALGAPHQCLARTQPVRGRDSRHSPEAQKWGLSADCIYQWLHAFLLQRLDSLTYRTSPGRPGTAPRRGGPVPHLAGAARQVDAAPETTLMPTARHWTASRRLCQCLLE